MNPKTPPPNARNANRLNASGGEAALALSNSETASLHSGTAQTHGAALPGEPAPTHGSIGIPTSGGAFRRFLAFAGPAFLVSVGYMDPGNWATDIAAGSQYRYRLLWVVLASSLMAILLQTLSVRLGIVTRRDLAQMCRESFRRPIVIALWIMAEIAIAACDLAEVLGCAIALNLLFHIPLLAGVLLTAFDVLLLLGLQHRGMRWIEALIVTLVATIGACYLLEIVLSRPDWIGIAHGLTTPNLPDKSSLFLALGILGATVMPHNLYLHSALVQSRRIERTRDGVRSALKYNFLETMLALNAAFLVNAAILVMAAAVFHRYGKTDVTDIQSAHETLRPLLGRAATLAFAIALLASGQSSTITGTLAGQIVMEGFVHWRINPALRQIVTRTLAIVPAVIVIAWYGRGGGAAQNQAVNNLLLVSQVVLSLQLSFATIPLVLFTSDPKRMGEWVNAAWLRVLSWIVALGIAALNVVLLHNQFADWLHSEALAKLALAGMGLAACAFTAWAVARTPKAQPAT